MSGWALFACKLSIAGGLLFLVWRSADGPKALDRIASVDWRWVLMALVVLHAHTLLSALRWQFTARQLGLRLGTRQAIGEYYLAQIVNQSLPGGMLGDAGRAVRGRGEAGLAVSGHAVILERLAGQIAMVVTLTAAVCFTAAVPGGLDWPGWLVGPIAVLVAAAFALSAGLVALARLPGPLGQRAASFTRSFGAALASRYVLLPQIAMSLGTTATILLAFALCARAVGLSLPASVIITLVPLILLTMLIPISVSGWGLREGAAAALLPLAGASTGEGLAASVVFGMSGLAAALPGVLVLLAGPRRARSGCKSPLRRSPLV